MALLASDGFGLFSQLRDRLNEEDLLLSLMVARNIWLRRNSFVFESFFNPPQQVMCKATEAAAYFLMCHEKPPSMAHVQEPIAPRWSPPPRGYLKMNWDAAFNKASRSMGPWVVVVLAQFLPQVTDPSIAEAVALWRAVWLCGELGYTKVVFEGDSLLIVEAVGQGSPCSRNFGQLIEDTRIVLQSFQSFTVQHVKRVANQAAHVLATLALSQLIDFVWRGECPSPIYQVVLH